MIISMSKCDSNHKGNVLSWESRYLEVHNTSTQKTDTKVFCQQVEKLVLITDKLQLDQAMEYCEVHGGYLYTPTSPENNTLMMNMLKRKLDSCLHKSMRHLAWLGMEPRPKSKEKIWMHSYSKVNLTYLNFDDVESWHDDCGIMSSDGSWTTRAYGDCLQIKLCFVCAFEQEPIYTIRGLCKYSQYDFNFYLSFQEGGIEYVGYKDAKIWKRDSSWILSKTLESLVLNYSILAAEGLYHPLGRHTWTVSDNTCPKGLQQQQLTISTCKLNESFTCDSGQCIHILKRCDNINDCKDSSDEENCMFIKPDSTYSPYEPPNSEIPGQYNPLWISVKIIQFDDVDTIKMHLTLTMDVKVQWFDPRLRFENLNMDRPNLETEINGKEKICE